MKLFIKNLCNNKAYIQHVFSKEYARSGLPASVGIPQLAHCKNHFLHVVAVRSNLELADLTMINS